MTQSEQGEGAFKVHKNQSWQLSKPLLIVFYATQNIELIPALHQEKLEEGRKTGVREGKWQQKEARTWKWHCALCKSSDIKFGSNLVQAAGSRF